jgi:glucose dehydrogenase
VAQVTKTGFVFVFDRRSGEPAGMGTIVWQSVLGEFDELTKRGVKKTGAPNLGGSIVTAGGLVFIAATNDKRFRAFDNHDLWFHVRVH